MLDGWTAVCATRCRTLMLVQLRQDIVRWCPAQALELPLSDLTVGATRESMRDSFCIADLSYRPSD